MPSDYLKWTCKTCGATSLSEAAKAQMQGRKYLLHCNSRHQHTYDAEEIEILPLETSRGIRAKLGLTDDPAS